MTNTTVPSLLICLMVNYVDNWHHPVHLDVFSLFFLHSAYTQTYTLSFSLSLSLTHTHTHTYTFFIQHIPTNGAVMDCRHPSGKQRASEMGQRRYHDDQKKSKNEKRVKNVVWLKKIQTHLITLLMIVTSITMSSDEKDITFVL